MGLTTVSATTIGMWVGNWLTDTTGELGRDRWWLSAAVLLTLAVAGWLASMLIARVPAANPGRRFPWDAGRQTLRDLRTQAFVGLCQAIAR